MVQVHRADVDARKRELTASGMFYDLRMIFGRPIIRPTDLAKFVSKKLMPYAGRLQRRSAINVNQSVKKKKSRAIRTQSLMVQLRRLGRKHKLHIFPDNRRNLRKRRPEWLVDLVWWEESLNHTGVALAVESEWNAPVDDIVADFEKLLIIKSPLKLMVYRVRGKDLDRVREGIRQNLLKYGQHVPGESYVLCEFLPNWKCTAYMYRVKQVNKNGTIADLKFHKINLG
jgi:hypothetical protein